MDTHPAQQACADHGRSEAIRDMRFEDQDPPWPFRPFHITNDGDAAGLTGTGIITNRRLQAFQTEICERVRLPTAVFEFTADGEIVDTDSPLIMHTMNAACRAFRKGGCLARRHEANVLHEPEGAAETAMCAATDRAHAALFMDLLLDDLTAATLTERIAGSRSLQDLHEEAGSLAVSILEVQDRLVIAYDCPLLGFKNLMIPVLIEGRVLGALLAGQMIPTSHELLITQRILSLPGRFAGGSTANRKGTLAGAMGRGQKKAARRLLKEFRRSLDAQGGPVVDDLEEVASRAVDEVKDLELFLRKQLMFERTRYIVDNVTEELRHLSLPTTSTVQFDPAGGNPLLRLWDVVEEALDRLANCFSLRYVVVFGPKHPNHPHEENLAVVAATRGAHEQLPTRLLEDLRLDTSLLPDEYAVCSPSVKPELLNCLQGFRPAVFGDFQLVLVPVPLFKSSSIAFLVGYTSEHPRSAPENRPDSQLDTALQWFNTVVISAVEALLGRAAEEVASRQMTYLGHEAGQLVAGLSWLRESHMRDGSMLRATPLPKLDDMCKNLESFVGQLSLIFEMTAIVGTQKLPDVQPESFQPLATLFKWKDTYRQEAEKKRLQIRVAPGSDQRHPHIYADPFLFEEVVYNLVGNAEKYCYRGTTIDLDCRLESPDVPTSPHVLTVTDYGRYMPPGEQLYLPYVRKEESIGGLGLGLYVVWLIVTALHGGNVFHECDERPVSRFNIPLIKPYLERDFPEKDKALARELRAEMDRLMRPGAYDSIVALEPDGLTPRYLPTDGALTSEIMKPTFRVRVVARIPSQIGRK